MQSTADLKQEIIDYIESICDECIESDIWIDSDTYENYDTYFTDAEKSDLERWIKDIATVEDIQNGAEYNDFEGERKIRQLLLTKQ